MLRFRRHCCCRISAIGRLCGDCGKRISKNEAAAATVDAIRKSRFGQEFASACRVVGKHIVRLITGRDHYAFRRFITWTGGTKLRAAPRSDPKIWAICSFWVAILRA